jgi:hypothetical protein
MTTRTEASHNPELVDVPDRLLLMTDGRGDPNGSPGSRTRAVSAEREFPAITVAWTVHRGPFEEIGPTYHTVAGWTQEHGHEVAGPPREVYLTDRPRRRTRPITSPRSSSQSTPSGCRQPGSQTDIRKVLRPSRLI